MALIIKCCLNFLCYPEEEIQLFQKIVRTFTFQVRDELDRSSDFFRKYKMWKGEAPPCFVRYLFISRMWMGWITFSQRKAACSSLSLHYTMSALLLSLMPYTDVWKSLEIILEFYQKKQSEKTSSWFTKLLMRCLTLDILNQWQLKRSKISLWILQLWCLSKLNHHLSLQF